MDAKQIVESMDISLFDDEYRAIVEKLAADDVKKVEKQILPYDSRLKFYRYIIEEVKRVDDEVPVAICMEDRQMWDDLEDEIGMTADEHVCCCDPLMVPGNPMLPS